MREEIGDVFTALSVLLELPLRADDTATGFLTATPKGLHLNGLAIERIHLGFVVKGVHLARPAVHEQKDHVLGLARQRRIFRFERIIPRRLAVGRMRLIS